MTRHEFQTVLAEVRRSVFADRCDAVEALDNLTALHPLHLPMPPEIARL